MSHADVLVCDSDHNKMQGHPYQNMEGSSCVDRLATYRLIGLLSSIS